MFVTPMLEPEMLHSTETLKISRWRPPYEEFSCVRIQGNLETPLKILFEDFAVIANNLENVGLGYESGDKNGNMYLGKFGTALIEAGCVVTLKGGNYHCFVCLENKDENVKVLD